MIRIELGVEDLADTRFAISPLAETVFSLWALAEPGRSAMHMPWLRSIRPALDGLDARLLRSLVGPTRAVPDLLTPRPATFAPAFADELAAVRAASPELVRRDLRAAHAPAPVPTELGAVEGRSDARVVALLHAVCDVLAAYWTATLERVWPQMRLVLEADMTYRARRLATGGARLLFADMHPNLRWRDGVLHIGDMIGRHTVAAAGRGLLLIPSVFAYKPVPPISPEDPPSLAYPSRGVGTLWAPPRETEPTALDALLGAARARLLRLLDEPLPTVELARRLRVTPSAVSQHLQVMHGTGLVDRARDGRHVLYRRSPLGDQLAGAAAPTGQPT